MAQTELAQWQNKFFTEDSTQVLLNPALSSSEADSLLSLAKKNTLAAHVWIASSGSSSSANESVKLIALSKKAILSSAKAANQHLFVNKTDVWAQVLPLFHVGGLGIEARSYLSDSKVISALKDGKWDPEYYQTVCEKEKVTLGSLVPTQVFDLVSKKLKAPKGFRAIVVGGAALSQDLYEQGVALGWPLLPSFGMTECCSQIATATIEDLQFQDRSLKILSHLKARTNSEGLIEVSGSSLLTGYAQIKDGKDYFIDPKNQGWLTTSDRGQVRDHILIPEGRAGDFVKILGEGVSLHQLDQTLLQTLKSLNVKNPKSFALVAAPDQRAGAKIVLMIDDADVGAKTILEVIKGFDEKVKAFEKIKEHHFVDQIPRSDLGKIQRAKLLEKLK